MDVPEAMMLKALKVQGFPEAMPTQLSLYANEYRRGAFAIHAPNNVVRALTGKEPDDFETIARRIVATRPEAVRTFGNKLKAIRTFLSILMTAKIDPDAVECRRDHVLLKSPSFVGDSQVWRMTHDPTTGYLPDVPNRKDDATPPVQGASA